MKIVETPQDHLSENEEIDTDLEEEEDEDEPCVVCGDEEAVSKNNAMIFCDGENCDIPVHLKCYGVAEVPAGKWYCDRCEDGVPVENTPAICCANKGGAFKRTNHPGKYIHIPCAWFNNVEKNQAGVYCVEKWLIGKQKCYICDSNFGLTSRCKFPDCKKWFHIMCAVGNQTLSLVKQKDIKPGVLCDDHINSRIKNTPKLNTSDSILNIFGDAESTASETTPDASNQSLKRVAHPSDRNNSRKHQKIENFDQDLKKFLENIKTIKKAIQEIEEIPEGAKISKLKETTTKEKQSPLDSLLDDAFARSMAGKKTEDSKMVPEDLKPVDDSAKFRPYISTPSGADLPKIDSVSKSDRENIIAIFAHLQLSNLPVPNDSNLSQYLQLLRQMLDRASNCTTPASPYAVAIVE